MGSILQQCITGWASEIPVPRGWRQDDQGFKGNPCYTVSLRSAWLCETHSSKTWKIREKNFYRPVKGTKFRSKEPSAFQVISRWQVLMKRRAGRFPEVLVLCRRLSRFGLPRLSWVLELGWVMGLIGQKQQNPFTTECVHQQMLKTSPVFIRRQEAVQTNPAKSTQWRSLKRMEMWFPNKEERKKSWKLGHIISPRKWGKPGEDTKS